jgi:hypothetical protein
MNEIRHLRFEAALKFVVDLIRQIKLSQDRPQKGTKRGPKGGKLF